jgi:hypothetical protein
MLARPTVKHQEKQPYVAIQAKVSMSDIPVVLPALMYPSSMPGIKSFS